MIAVSKEWIVGDPLDPATKVGPMIRKGHMEKVLGYIEAGKTEGARLVLGGKQALKDTGGYFVEPTIFDQVRNDMSIAREEIFGPVLSTFSFSDEEEGVALANDTNLRPDGVGLYRESSAAPIASPALCAPAPSRSTASPKAMSPRRSADSNNPASWGATNPSSPTTNTRELKTIWMQLKRTRS